MDTSARAPGYDIFKSIVAIILLVIFLFLLQRPTPQSLVPESTTTSPTAIPSVNPSRTPELNPAAVTMSATSFPAPETPVPVSSPTVTVEAVATPAVSTPTATITDALSPTSSPSQTAKPVIAPTLTPVVETPSIPTACEVAAARSQLQRGMGATILRRLNFRSSPGIRNNWLRTNIPGTEVEVVGGPECMPHLTGAYVWWQIRLPDGELGWSAEGSIHGSCYIIETAE